MMIRIEIQHRGIMYNNQGHPQYLKMEVIPDVKGKTLVEFANSYVSE